MSKALDGLIFGIRRLFLAGVEQTAPSALDLSAEFLTAQGTTPEGTVKTAVRLANAALAFSEQFTVTPTTVDGQLLRTVSLPVGASTSAYVGGSGEDGDLTASSGVTTLTKPTSYANVTLTGTAQINCAGWPLNIQTFHAENAPARAIYSAGVIGADGTTQGPAVTPVNGSYLGGSSAGGSGGGGGGINTVGTAGSQAGAVTSGAGGVGGVGGAGGTSSTSKAGGAGGAQRNPTLQAYPSVFEPIRPLLTSTTGIGFEVISGGCGGGGGGGGGGNGSNSGGDGRGGGSGAPVLEVWIGELITGASTPAALIDSYGGGGNTPAGTPPGGGGSGGGAGGGGGHTRVFIGKRTGTAVANLICANGGDGGAGGAAAGGGTAGVGGSAGGGGRVLVHVHETGQCFVKPRETAGAAASGVAGGVHTVWGVTV